MKKLLCIMLALTMVLGMSVGVSAADAVAAPAAATSVVTTGIKGINKDDIINILESNAASGLITVTSKSGSDLSISSLSDFGDMEIAPGDVIQIPFTANMFTYAKNTNGADGEGKRTDTSFVSTSALSSANITFKTTVSSGSGSLIFSIAGNKSKAYIKIEAADNPAFDGQKFSYAMYLSHKGIREGNSRIRIKGVVQAPQVEVDNSDDYVDISNGQSVKALTAVRGIEIYIGEYCTIKRNLVRGNVYSGKATTEILESDEKYFDKYSELEYIYRLETVRLKGEGKIVTFELDDKFYVYNSKGEYIGTSNEALPYWTKYFMTTKKYAKLEI